MARSFAGYFFECMGYRQQPLKRELTRKRLLRSFANNQVETFTATMSNYFQPIIGTLGFVMSPCQEQTLLVHRISRSHDAHLGKYNGLGGKMLRDEDVVTCMKREIMEEAGIVCLDVKLRGTINWTGFGQKGEDWLGFIFRIDQFSGVPYSTNEEGPLSWQPVSNLAKLPMWEGDRHFLPMVFDEDPRAFHGSMPYRDGHPLRWTYSRI